MKVPIAVNPIRRNDLAYEPGDRVSDRYIIDEFIGRGGMGVVYQAQDTLIDEIVALKFMNPKLLRTSRGQQLFIQEAQVARKLRHENIVAVHDVNWTTDGILYISMEFARGQSLRALLRKQRTDRRFLEVRLVVKIMTQILDALDFAHRNVIHRDIKPENIMFLANEQVKVLDFGLAKAVDEGFDASAEGGKLIGTRAYAAPEQIKHTAIDLRADIYSLGLVMHELLTLRTPMDEPVKVPQVRPDVSPSLLAVLDRAVKEERERRWQSSREFRVALETAFNESYRKSQVTVVQGNETTKQASTDGMVFLEGGRFLMGNNDILEESPEEEVAVEPFWMDIHPVTVAQYEAFIKETRAPEPKWWRDPQYNGPNQPVVGASWEQALAYAHWCGKTLPTEAQWEFAARGTQNRKYPWGNLQPDATRANFGDHLGMPSIVTMHEEGKTPDGIMDLAGNVLEWTLDPYLPYSTLRKNPEAGANTPRRAARGGCWVSPVEQLTCTARQGPFAESQLATLGFRCVLSANKK